MKKQTLSLLVRVAVGLAILVAFLPTAVRADGASNVSGNIAPGGNSIVFTIPSTGDNTKLLLTANISPVDIYSNQGIALDVFSVPTTGGSTKVDTAGTNPSLASKRALFNMNVAGSYVVVIHNWDPLGRTLHIDMSALNTVTGLLAPVLTQVSPAPSSSAPAPSVQPAPAGASSAAPQASSVAPTPNNAVVTVLMNEMTLKPSIASVPAGKVTFIGVNQGKVDHEVVILKTDKAPNALVLLTGLSKVNEAASGENLGEVEVEAGTTEAGTFNLSPGNYVLVCNLLGHYQAGMFAAFQVTGAGAATAAPAQQAAPATAVAPAAPASSAPAASGERKDVTLFKAVRPYLVRTLDAAQAGDRAAASKFQHQYDIEWHGVEVYLNVRSAQLYGQLETDIQARLIKLLDDPKSSQADIVATTKELLAKYDECIQAVQNAPAISPLFDDLAAIRTLKAETINEIDPVLKAGDVATAKALFTQFMTGWSDIEDTIKAFSSDLYATIEGSMAKTNAGFQKSNPNADDLRPLVADTLAQYNFGQAVINAAARGADMTKTAYTQQDVQLAASVGNISAELNASLTAWKSGNYQSAGDHAKNASGKLFDSVAAPLNAKGGADAALKKALDAYTALATQAGDATAVQGAQTAAVQAARVAQQTLVGQFWTDPKFKDALTAALSSR